MSMRKVPKEDLRRIVLSKDACVLLMQLAASEREGPRSVYGLGIYHVSVLRRVLEVALPELGANGLVSYERYIGIDPHDGHDDVTELFVRAFFKLVEQGDFDGASEYARLGGRPELEQLLVGKIDFPDLLAMCDTGSAEDDVFFYGLYPFLRLFVRVEKKGLLWLARNTDMVSTIRAGQWPFPKEEEKTFYPPDFNTVTGVLVIEGREVKLSLASRQFETLRALWEDPRKDWQFDELNDRIERHAPKGQWKRLHSIFLAIRDKIRIETGIANFFLLNTQSVQINPAMWDPPPPELLRNSADDEWEW